MSNNQIPELDFDEKKLDFLLQNVDKIPQILSKQELDSLIEKLKNNLGLIEEAIDLLKETSKE